jgi:hypothetical protein
MKRDDYLRSIGATPLPKANEDYALMDSMGAYADPRIAKRPPSVHVFPERDALPGVCFGVGCPQHATCAKWLAIEGANPDAPRMARCSEGAERPGFSEIS